MLRESETIKTKVIRRPEPELKKVSHENRFRNPVDLINEVMKESFALILEGVEGHHLPDFP